MNFKDLIKLYEELKKKYDKNAYRHISSLLRMAKDIHRRDFIQSKTAKRAQMEGRTPDHEQSWRAFKGKNLEKLIKHILMDEIKHLGLKIIEGTILERTNSANLSEELNRVKRNLLVDYGEFGSHLPDVDLIIYEPHSCKVISTISSKVTLRERIAQTGYWKIKLAADNVTKHVKVFFITPDEDGTLISKKPAKKGRAIVEIDTDGGYVMSETEVEESNKVKMFDKFIDDIRMLINT